MDEMMRVIRASDPDGGTTEPGFAAYAAFDAWVVKTYGEAALRRYRRSNWDEGEWV